MTISIITIVYNAKHCISDCIKSVMSQTYPNIEHIVIDGGSTDGTQEEIEKYIDNLAYYISEKDEGIYDAYNKGLKKATGDIIGTLNSDDFFYEPDTLKRIADAFRTSGADLVYAQGFFVDKKDISKIKRIYPSKPFRKHYLLYGWIPLHTTIFAKKELFHKYGGYKCGYKIASDYEISLRWFQNDDIEKYFLNKWVVKMRLGGLSTSPKHQMQKSLEDLSIIKQYRLKGVLTLACKIGRKIPQYLAPRFKRFDPIDP